MVDDNLNVLELVIKATHKVYSATMRKILYKGQPPSAPRDHEFIDEIKIVHFYPNCNRIVGKTCFIERDKSWEHHICQKCSERNERELYDALPNLICAILISCLMDKAKKEGRT